ncbi:hypothetical protein WN48_00509 [Eufriesea mexicana]|nr:hypothetical protein WN48_00509 [Eufriesea mexicana]
MTESPIPSVSNVQTHTRAPSQSQVQTQIQDDKNEKTDKAILLQIQEINSQVAQFRDLLISIGQPRDCPELREKIRRLRRNCVEACKNTSRFVLPQVRRTTDIGIPVDCPNSMLLFYVIQLFLRELCKSKNLIRIVPMDMTEYYETRTGPSNIGNVISQIVLCKQITPNFYEEELCSIQKDSEEIRGLINELQEFMPQSASDIGTVAFPVCHSLSTPVGKISFHCTNPPRSDSFFTCRVVEFTMCRHFEDDITNAISYQRADVQRGRLWKR